MTVGSSKKVTAFLFYFSRWKKNSRTNSSQEHNTDQTACEPAEVKTNCNLSTGQLKLQDNHATFAQMGFCIMQDRDECCPLMQ